MTGAELDKKITSVHLFPNRHPSVLEAVFYPDIVSGHVYLSYTFYIIKSVTLTDAQVVHLTQTVKKIDFAEPKDFIFSWNAEVRWKKPQIQSQHCLIYKSYRPANTEPPQKGLRKHSSEIKGVKSKHYFQSLPATSRNLSFIRLFYRNSEKIVSGLVFDLTVCTRWELFS